MNLRRRRKRKTEQALDAAASVSKLWSEWNLGKRAAKGVAKVKDVRPPSKLKRVLSFKWVRIGGAAAVVGGGAAVIARKLKGDDPADYTGPPPSAAADAGAPATPLSVAPDPATQERDTEPASGPTALRANRDAAAAAAAAEATTDTPEAVSDAAEDAPAAVSDTAQDAPEPADDAPEPAGDTADAAPEPDSGSDDEKFAPGTTTDSQDVAADEDVPDATAEADK